MEWGIQKSWRIVVKLASISLFIIMMELLLFPLKQKRSEHLGIGMSLSDVEYVMGCQGKQQPGFWVYEKCGATFFEVRWEDALTEIDVKMKGPPTGTKGEVVAIHRSEKSVAGVVLWFLPMSILISVFWIWVLVLSRRDYRTTVAT